MWWRYSRTIQSDLAGAGLGVAKSLLYFDEVDGTLFTVSLEDTALLI